MTEENLKKANDYKNQIYNLKKFSNSVCMAWHILRLKHPKFKMRTAYGCVSDEIEVSEELAKRILKTIDDYVYSLECEFEKM